MIYHYFSWWKSVTSVDSTIECQIQGVYMGIWVYADDIILLSPSRTSLQEMVKICENFAKATELKLSTNIQIEKCKTKCLICSKERINYNEITPI